MVNSISIHVSKGYTSRDIKTDSFSRSTTSATVENAIAGLPTEDRAVLRAFLATMRQTIDQAHQLPKQAQQESR